MREPNGLHAPADGKLRIVPCFRSPVGGFFRHARDLATAQTAERQSVDIACDSTTGDAREEERFDVLRPHPALGLHRTPMQRRVSSPDIHAFLRRLRRIMALHPDVLHTHGAKGEMYGRIIGTPLRVFGSSVARIYGPRSGSLPPAPGRACAGMGGASISARRGHPAVARLGVVALPRAH